jgi:hypothetical protein
MAVRKEDLTRFLRGHALAGLLVRAEQAHRLAELTASEALAEYEDLCRVWYRAPRPPEVDPERLAFLLRLRDTFALQAR